MTGTLSAQTVVDYSTFEQKVLDYSQTLKQSVAQRTAMQKAMKRQKPLSFRLLMQREAISIVLTNTRWILAEWLSYGARFIQCRSRGITTYLCRWQYLSQL